MIYGHDAVRSTLEAELPQVVLLRGPASVGKRTLANHLQQHHGVQDVDTRRYLKLSAEDARDLKQFAGTAPMGRTKLAIIRIDSASSQSLNALLKLLEEPPRTASFIMTAVRPPLDTIASRSMVHRLGLLTEDQLTSILVHRLGMDEKNASRAAVLGRGQVSAALLAGEQDTSRAYVLSVLKAVRDSDHELLDQALSKWDYAAHQLLVRWATEAFTGRWQAFSESETFGLPELGVPRKLLTSLSLQARPKLAARAALEPLLRKA